MNVEKLILAGPHRRRQVILRTGTGTAPEFNLLLLLFCAQRFEPLAFFDTNVQMLVASIIGVLLIARIYKNAATPLAARLWAIEALHTNAFGFAAFLYIVGLRPWLLGAPPAAEPMPCGTGGNEILDAIIASVRAAALFVNAAGLVLSLMLVRTNLPPLIPIPATAAAKED